MGDLDSEKIKTWLSSMGPNPSIGYIMFSLFMAVSYAVGSILYRRPLNHVDAISSFRQWCCSDEDERKGLSVQFSGLPLKKGKILCVKYVCVKFPIIGKIRDQLLKVEQKITKHTIWQVITKCPIIFHKVRCFEHILICIIKILWFVLLPLRIVWLYLSSRVTPHAKLLVDYYKAMTDIYQRTGWWQHFYALTQPWTYMAGRSEVIIKGCKKMHLEIDFPYPYLRCSLCRKGMVQWAKFVSWGKQSYWDSTQVTPEQGKSPEQRKSPCKNFINSLKYLIRHHGTDDMIREMERTESHIRMLNSLWYSFRFVRTIIFSCCFATLVFFVVSNKTVETINYGQNSGLLLQTEKCYVLEGKKYYTLKQLVNNNEQCKNVEPSLVGIFISVLKDKLRQWHISNIRKIIGDNSYNKIKAGCKLLCKKVRIAIKRCGWYCFGMGLLFFVVTLCRRGIEIGFHYVREREIFNILAQVEIIDKEDIYDKPDKKIFSNVLVAAEQFATLCKDMKCKHAGNKDSSEP